MRIMRFLLAFFSVSLCVSAHAQVSSTEIPFGFSAIKTAQSKGSIEAMVVDGGGWTTWRKLSHVAILVQHPKGDILYDTGIGKDVVSQMEVFNLLDQQLFAIEGLNPARDQLEQHAYDLKRLNAIVVGHMHWDHVSGLEDFLGTPVWVPEEALDEARAGEPPGFVMSQYDDPDINWQPVTLHSAPYLGFERSLDVYGDGRIVLVDLTGHADGQLGMVLNLDNGDQYFFIGDTTWTIEGVKKNRSRPVFVQWMTGVDRNYELNAKLINTLHELDKNNTELVIVPAHDENVLKTLPRYPAMR